MSTHIAKLRLKNFKSFKKAIIPFNKGFTAIAGSNGSGKSNILDAIMFGLGITSLKRLRASRLTDLVNNDASEDYAVVELELQGDKENYVLSRTIDKKGVGVYRLNEKRSTLNEIASLLVELGIRADGHNIVVQGDITRIIEMNPVQRREIIDDLAGIREFEEKKNEALKELDKVDTKIKEVNIVIKERGAYLEELTKEREKALEFTKLEKEKKESKATILKKEMDKIKLSQTEFNKKIEALQKQREILTERKNQLIVQKQSLKKNIEELNQKIIDASEKTFSGLGIQAEETKTQKKLLEEKINSKKDLIHRLSARKQSVEEKVAELVSENTNHQDLLKEKQKEEKILVEKIKQKNEAIKKQGLSPEITKTVKQKQFEIKELRESLHAENEKMHEVKQEVHGLENNVNTLEMVLSELLNDAKIKKVKEKTIEMLELKQQLAKEHNKLIELSDFIETAMKKSADYDTVLKKITEIKNLRQEINKKISEVHELLLELGQEEKQKQLIEQQKLSMKSIETKTKALNELMQKLSAKTKNLAEKEAEFNALSEIIEKNSSLLQELNDLKNSGLKIDLEISSLKVNLEAFDDRTTELNKELNELDSEIISSKQRIESDESEIKHLDKKLKDLELEIEKANKGTQSLKDDKVNKDEKLFESEDKIQKLEEKFRETEKQENEMNIEQSKNEVRFADLNEEYKNFEGIKILEEDNLSKLKTRIEEIEKLVVKMGAINMRALESFGEFEKEMHEIKSKADKLEQERLAVLEMIEKIEDKRTKVFMECFEQISGNFNRMYSALAEGEGKLSISNPENVLESGLMIEAKHKLDKLKNIDSMSGGEKTLTALAFLFAIQLYQPAPFYIFDEADAALDKENSVKLARMIAEVSKTSQFIAITHNDSVIREADQLVGVTLNKDKSSVIGLKLKEEIIAQA
ncbi:MAG: AAA family ATPase [archaeon]|nr:AAA family ATPase [archaeon]